MRIKPTNLAVMAVAFLSLTGLGGCAAVDQFNTRAMTYNNQADDIKEQQFLLNVIRAAYRAPLQFTDFSQVTGQSSVSGTAAFSLPISTFPATMSRTYLATPSATVSGTQSFTVANLDTQNFYQGILAPIPLSTIDYYTEENFPKPLLLTLLVSRIELQPAGSPNALPVEFYNSYVGDDYQKFEAMLQALIDLGLSTESVKTLQTIGAPMTAAELGDVHSLSTILGQGVTLKTYTLKTGGRPSDPNLSPDEAAAFASQHVDEYYRLQTDSKQSRFCMATALEGATVPGPDLPDATKELAIAGLLAPGEALSSGTVPVPKAENCGASAADRKQAEDEAELQEDSGDGDANVLSFTITSGAGDSDVRQYKVKFYIRSVEGIMYYLGEMVRGELALGTNAPPIAPPRVQTQLGGDMLFVVHQDCEAQSPSVTTNFFGASYCIEIDPSGQDRSSEVMEIVSQLFALNVSASSLPSPNVISVLSP